VCPWVWVRPCPTAPRPVWRFRDGAARAGSAWNATRRSGDDRRSSVQQRRRAREGHRCACASETRRSGPLTVGTRPTHQARSRGRGQRHTAVQGYPASHHLSLPSDRPPPVTPSRRSDNRWRAVPLPECSPRGVDTTTTLPLSSRNPLNRSRQDTPSPLGERTVSSDVPVSEATHLAGPPHPLRSRRYPYPAGKRGRAAECIRLESGSRATDRGFESLRFRKLLLTSVNIVNEVNRCVTSTRSCMIDSPMSENSACGHPLGWLQKSPLRTAADPPRW
jgi:hypothetical protein